VQFAYAAAGEGLAITTESMTVCSFPDVIALPFAEPLPELQLGLAAMETNESSAMTIFRKVVTECAAVAFQRRVVRLQPAQGMSQAPIFSERRQAS
jgi:hypothetical protein